VPTPLSSFGPDVVQRSAALQLDTARGTRTALGAFIGAAASAVRLECHQRRPIPADRSTTTPGRSRRHRQRRGSGCDVLLDLHGAMVSRSFDDSEGELRQACVAETPPRSRSTSTANITSR
jgi:hypothetical protein